MISDGQIQVNVRFASTKMKMKPKMPSHLYQSHQIILIIVCISIVSVLMHAVNVKQLQLQQLLKLPK
jgi:hypothetical protein